MKENRWLIRLFLLLAILFGLLLENSFAQDVNETKEGTVICRTEKCMKIIDKFNDGVAEVWKLTEKMGRLRISLLMESPSEWILPLDRAGVLKEIEESAALLKKTIEQIRKMEAAKE